eukprot:SAG31_NODE_19179_length_610_cov_0.759295_2_plen_27_part_01
MKLRGPHVYSRREVVARKNSFFFLACA